MLFDFTKKKPLANLSAVSRKTEEKKPAQGNRAEKTRPLDKLNTLIVENKEAIDGSSLFAGVPVTDAQIGVMVDANTKNHRNRVSLYDQMVNAKKNAS